MSRSVAFCVFLASCAANSSLGAPEWSASVREALDADAAAHAEYRFVVVGKYDDDLPLVTLEGWLKQESNIREFRLYPRKSLLTAELPNKCLSGVFADDREFARARAFSGRRVRIYATYAPTGPMEVDGAMSVIGNVCLGDIEIHGKTLVLLD